MTAPLVLQYCHRLLQHSSCRRVPLSPITRQLRRARVTLQVDMWTMPLILLIMSHAFGVKHTTHVSICASAVLT